MKKLNVYSVYLDDGKDVFRVTVPAASKKDAAEYVRGNGDVVAIKPADLQDIDLDALADTLKRAQWGQMRNPTVSPTGGFSFFSAGAAFPCASKSFCTASGIFS